jgi:Transcriptional regulator
MAGERSPKKKEIEAAAMELFARHGFAGTTIKDIAQKSGVTEGALYRHYAGKEELALALFERELETVREQLMAALAIEERPVGKLRAVIHYLYDTYQKEPWPLLFVILNFQNLQGGQALDDKGHIYDFIIEFTKNLFDPAEDMGDLTQVGRRSSLFPDEQFLANRPAAVQGPIRGEDTADHEFRATLVTGLVVQPIIFHYYRKLPRHPLEYVDEVTRCCCRLIGLDY